MKISKITAAVAALVVSGTASAFAPGTQHQVNMFISGASAQDNAIAALITSMCLANTAVDVYKDTGGTGYTAWSCQLDSASVSPAVFSVNNPSALIQKRSAGGSGMGVGPVADGALIDSMPIGGNCTMGVANGTGPTGTEGHDWSCSLPGAGSNQSVPDMGVSDVNPGMFVGENTPGGFSPVTAAQLSQLTVKPAAVLIFGVPVTTELRDALQVAQFGAADPCATGADGAKPWSALTLPTRETEACMPTLSSNQIASIMSGQIKTWDQFYVGGTALTAVTGVTAPADHKVQICRRTNGSGTQAQNNAVFLRYPCTTASLATLPAHNSVLGGFFGPVVYENSGAGDVDKCLDDFNTGGNSGVNVDYATGAKVANNPTGAHRWAIGLQSLEKNYDLGKGYRFVKVDGVSPTLTNAANGTYKDWVEQSYQWRSALTGDNAIIANHIANLAASPTYLGNQDTGTFTYPFGVSGFLAVSTNGFAPSSTGVLDPNAPVMPYTHAPAGFSLDNCRIPTVSVNSALKN